MPFQWFFTEELKTKSETAKLESVTHTGISSSLCIACTLKKGEVTRMTNLITLLQDPFLEDFADQ